MADVDTSEDQKAQEMREAGSGIPETKKVALYNANDGVVGRDGGPYLDVVEMENAERVRARKEDREPDYDPASMASTAGINLVPANRLVVHHNQVGTVINEDAGTTGLFLEETAPPVYAEPEVQVPGENNVPMPPYSGQLSPTANPNVPSERKSIEEHTGEKLVSDTHGAGVDKAAIGSGEVNNPPQTPEIEDNDTPEEGASGQDKGKSTVLGSKTSAKSDDKSKSGK